MRIISTVVLMALVNSIFLTGCASVRGPTRLARLQETPAVEPAIQSWDAVAFIPAVSPLEVDLTTGETLNGLFRSVDEQTLVIEQDGAIRSVPRAEIRRVVMNRGSHAGRGSLWGLGSGAVIGLAATITTEGSDTGGAFTVVFTAMFAGIGAGIGALIGAVSPDWAVIYESPVSGATN